MSTPLERALEDVAEDAFTLDGGRPLPQASSRALVARVLSALDVRPGMSVLEVGTGSGYATALLAHIVGSAGTVASVDVDPALCARAQRLLGDAGFAHATCAPGDARRTLPEGGPYDRLVAWATADRLPGRWIEALRDGARACAPVQLLPLDGAAPVACLEVAAGAPSIERFLEGGFIPLTDAPVVDFEALSARRGDVRRTDPSGTAWLSAPWLRAGSGDLRRRLTGVLSGLRPGPQLLQPSERAEDLWWFLAATGPTGLTSAGGPAFGAAFGHGGPDGLALLRRAPGADAGDGRSLTAGNAMRSVLQLQGWIRAWQAAGRPGLDALQGACRWDEAAHSWTVRATVRS